MSAPWTLVNPPRRTALLLGIAVLAALTALLWPRPSPATANPVAGVVSVSAGAEHSCLLTEDGAMKCWGANEMGQLGAETTDTCHVLTIGDVPCSRTPVDVTGVAGVAAVSAGARHTCALTTSGGVKCWGSAYGPVPVDVAGLSEGVAAVSAGGVHTCVLMSAGSVKCWGGNHSGQLGDGSDDGSSAPVDVVGLSSGVADVSAGGRHTCALTATGGVKCWGNNEDGQLGASTPETCGSTTSPFPCSRTPLDVPGLTSGMLAVTAGQNHTCALTAAGGVKCWGSNTMGQLGDAGACGMACLAPVDVVGLASGMATIVSKSNHTCALTVAGGAKCWGTNLVGELGDGQACGAVCATPADVVGLSSGVTEVAPGFNHTCATGATGGAMCWGDNTLGQVGDGTTLTRITPIDVVEESPKPTPTATPCPPEGCPTPTPTVAPCPPTGCPTPVPQLDFSLGVDVDGDGWDDCGTRAGESTTCSVSSGSTFGLKVYLSGLPPGVPSYMGYDALFEYAGATPNETQNLGFWPHCEFPAQSYYWPGWVGLACALGLEFSSSSHTGLMATTDFTCVESGTITMVHGPGYTTLWEYATHPYYEDQGTTETLTINCVVSPEPTVPPIGGVGAFPDATAPQWSGGGPVSVIGMALAAAVAGALALGGAAWYARRRLTR